MLERDKIIILNVLNGCGIPAAAAASNTTQGHVIDLMDRVNQAVIEFIALARTPYFDCATIEDLQANKARVLDVLDKLEAWDKREKGALLSIFRGEHLGAVLERFGLTRDEIMPIFEDVKIRIAGYLQGQEIYDYARNQREWIKRNEKRVTEILEQFTSLEAGQQLKNIRFQVQSGESA